MSEARGDAVLAIPCGDAATAEAVAAALAPDNEDYVSVRVEGDLLHITVPESGLGSLVRTVDDVLAAVTVGLRAGTA